MFSRNSIAVVGLVLGEIIFQASAVSATSCVPVTVTVTASCSPVTVTVIASSSLSSSSTASSTISSAIPTPTIVCPASNGTYVTSGSDTYLIECYVDHLAGDQGMVHTSNLNGCIDVCEATSGCVDVSWSPGSPGACYLKSSVGTSLSNSNVWGGLKQTQTGLSTATGTIVSVSASATPTLVCPDSGGQIVTAGSDQYQVQCYTDHAGGDMGSFYEPSLYACIALCESSPGCIDVSWVPGAPTGPCFLKNAVGAAVSNSVWGALKLSASSTSSTFATSTSSTLALATSSSISSSVSSSSSASTTTSPSSSATSSSSSSSSVSISSTTSSIVATVTSVVNQTTCNGQTYTYQQLAGYGFNPSNATDSYGDTIGGIGSGIAIDRTAWTKLANGSYTGVLYALPDRGWNTEGTFNYQPRLHKFNILFTPQPGATVAHPSGPNLFFYYSSSILFYGPDGITPCTGLDADGSGHYTYPGFPDLPVATYTGDGFGGNGATHQRIPIDSEAVHLNSDGTFWIGDEYGPYIYKFSQAGVMIAAIRPNDAIIPMRNGTESFSADSPYGYINGGAGDDVSPADNPTGRDNNHGFEGMTISGDGTTLYALLQAATNQEGGLAKQTERYARLVKYDISNPATNATYLAEYVVPLPLYNDPTAKASKNPKAAAQSEIFHISGAQFLILSRDSSAGNGQTVTTSVYRQADVFDISAATNIIGTQYDCATCAIASSAGVLVAGITPATYCSFLDFNVNSQLNRFGVHNGGVSNQYLLNEKWESLGMVPVDGLNGADGEYFLFSMSDNDFITQHGFLDFGNFPYADASGYNLDSQALVFQIKLPAGVNPFVGA